MFLRRFYYTIKPYLPWRMRMGLRRLLALRTRRAYRDVWPIDESAKTVPEGWPGWPDGKKFAFVVTHDVEGPDGLAKCRQLAALEIELGFRSSFNFIPEGPYRVPPEFRAWLTENGFEVGVHDLAHDGKLFQSRRSFKHKAVRINHHLREWGAAGFRAGFMLRRLEWMHDLDVQYDASTFDTDPFEPMSDGAGTIFPFWVPPPASSSGLVPPRHGYLELPYTLPQDSTLFLLLKETSPEIWFKKLDWVAAHGGMALVNVHPDYICFNGEKASPRTFPVKMYVELLQYVTRKYPGQFWNPLPRELAQWFKKPHVTGSRPPMPVPAMSINQPGATPRGTAGLRGKRVAVLLYSNYPSDPRPRRAAEAMIAAGMEVDLLCLTENESDLLEEVVHGVRVFRLPMKRHRGSKWNYLWQYGRFLLSSFWFLVRHGTRRKYDLVHVHNMPDVLVFSTLFSKLRGARVILDLHDPMPELMMTIYGLSEKRAAVGLLKTMEKWCIRVADAVLTVNEACKKLFSARSCPPEKVRVVMNAPDEGIFKYRELPVQAKPAVPATARPFVIMYHGSIVERHGLDLAVTALGKIKQSIPTAELRIYGHKTLYLDQVMDSVRNSDLRDTVHYLGSKKLEQIVEAIGDCDVGIIPNRRSLFTEINTPTRIFEYLSQAKPVIAPHAPGILDYFGPNELIYFEMGNADDLAEKIAQVFHQPAATEETVRRGQAVYREHAWHNERHHLMSLVAEVLGIEAPSKTTTSAGEMAVSKTGP